MLKLNKIVLKQRKNFTLLEGNNDNSLDGISSRGTETSCGEELGFF